MINSEMYRLGSAPSSIRELFEYGRKLKKEIGDENVFDFSLGNPSTPPPQAVLSEMEKILTESEPCALHGYSSAQGDLATRKAIAEDLYSRYGAKISPDKIYMTCGAAASLCITVRALVSGENNEFIVQAPFFPEYRVFTENNGGKLLVADADTENFELNIPAIEKLINEKTQGIIINSPNNPSGVIYSERSLNELASLLTEKSKEYGHPIYIISDEPYRELTYGKRVPYIPDIYPDTVICYSYSKSLSLPGERIGYIALPDGVSDIEELYYAVCGAGRSLGYVCAPTFMQKIVASCTGQVSDLTVYRKNLRKIIIINFVMNYF